MERIPTGLLVLVIAVLVALSSRGCDGGGPATWEPDCTGYASRYC